MTQEEKKLHDGLEEELDEMWLEWCEDVDYLVYASIARHFAEWGAEHTKQKPELVQHPAIGYMYNADAGRGEQLKQAILALLKSDLIQVAGRGFTKTELIDWVETRPAEMKEDEVLRNRHKELQASLLNLCDTVERYTNGAALRSELLNTVNAARLTAPGRGDPGMK